MKFYDGKFRMSVRVIVMVLLFFLTLTADRVGLSAQTADDLSKAAELFKREEYKEAIPILEKLAGDHRNDDQAVFGLGVALIMVANTEEDLEERKKMIIQAHLALIRAKELGVEDFFLDRHLDELSAGDDNNKVVKEFATLWALHPLQIFDTHPPYRISILDGYRHKSSVDFEGLLSGTIWKQDGLKIKYEFGGRFQGEGYKKVDKKDWRWYKEKSRGNHTFKYVLTKYGEIIITVYNKDLPIADFYSDIKNEKDVDEIFTMIIGLTEE